MEKFSYIRGIGDVHLGDNVISMYLTQSCIADLQVTNTFATPARAFTWGHLKVLYR
jgi:hypothetical protein